MIVIIIAIITIISFIIIMTTIAVNRLGQAKGWC